MTSPYKRRDTISWALYDWANSAFMTTVITALFPVFFEKEAAATLGSGEAERFFRVSEPLLGINRLMSDHNGARDPLGHPQLKESLQNGDGLLF